MSDKGIKRAVYEVMSAAYAEVSDGGRLPAPARQVGYATKGIEAKHYPRREGRAEDRRREELVCGRPSGLCIDTTGGE